MYVHVAQLGEYWGTNIRSSTVIMLMHVPSLLHRQTDTLYWWLVSSALTVFWVFLPRDDSSSSSPPRKDDLRPDRKEEMRHGGVDESRERKGGVGGEGGRRMSGRGRDLKTTLINHTLHITSHISHHTHHTTHITSHTSHHTHHITHITPHTSHHTHHTTGLKCVKVNIKICSSYGCGRM